VPQNFYFRITISLQPDNANLWYFNYRPVNLAEYNSWKLEPDCKNINFRKLQFEASVQFILILKFFFFSTAVRVGEYDISNTIPDCDKYENFCAPLPQVYSGLLDYPFLRYTVVFSTTPSSGIQCSTRLPLPQVYSGLLDYPFLRYTVVYSTTPSSGIQCSTRLPLPQVYSVLLDYPFFRYTVFYSTTPSSGIQGSSWLLFLWDFVTDFITCNWFNSKNALNSEQPFHPYHRGVICFSCLEILNPCYTSNKISSFWLILCATNLGTQRGAGES